ncbi:AsmA-like C-terminal region [Chitinophaga costaii]|uniref:AsmA-like C-terminal region n=1 Tax=Chitinophaga costaii TaxID=1335309 RepID=A0A1C4FF35_9BACT|nr:AsmA-like C-terminal region-containing protein [Chitinophaga costaii]PUZ20639.1 hypothetical protein DCM91_17870 [Chitinophaga costaii]SCC54245.1 AsmA-like C-terminal region [Chitinophaga costaii]
MLKRPWFRYTLYTLGGFLALLVLLWLGFAWYIHHNKARLLADISRQLEGSLNGKLTIADMEPALIESFPNISVQLQGVALSDSLGPVLHKPLIQAEAIYVRVNIFALLHKQVDIRQVTITNGQVYLFQDSTGYSNLYLIKPKHPGRPGVSKGNSPTIAKVELRNINFTFDNQEAHKLFDIDIQSFFGSMRYDKGSWTFSTSLHTLFHSFAFNTRNGSFLKDQTLEGTLNLHYDTAGHVLDIPEQRLKIGGQRVSLGLHFWLKEPAPHFDLQLNADDLPFSKAASWVSHNISRHFDTIYLQQPVNVQAHIQGSLLPNSQPKIQVKWQTQKNTLTVYGKDLTECSFNGIFDNERMKDSGFTDLNSSISAFNLKARYMNIPFSADTLQVINLIHPSIRAHFKSDFPLSDLNDATSGLFQFNNGTAKADMFYEGGFLPNDTTPPNMQGVVLINNAAFQYIPRQLSLHNSQVKLYFNGADLELHDMRLQSEKSILLMDGNAPNFLTLYFVNPSKISIDFNIRSSMLNANEFRGFLGKRKRTASKVVSQKARLKTVARLDAVLEACSVHLKASVDKFMYRRFNASNVKADLTLANDGIILSQGYMEHAGGTVSLKGRTFNKGDTDPFTIDAQVNKVKVDQFMDALNNFGLEDFTYKNVQGTFSAKAHLTGLLRDDGELVSSALNGSLSFSLINGALINVPMFKGISKFFPRRNLDNITFEDLQNNFTIHNGLVTIPPMHIATSAIVLDVKGQYALGKVKGTNVQLDVPIRNPKKDRDVADDTERRKRSRKGIVLHFNAVDGADGKVKLKLGKNDEAGNNIIDDEN